MEMSRRQFFGTVISAAGAVAYSKDPLKGPNLKVGVLSDTHVSNRKKQEKLTQVLKFYRKEGVDAVLIAGDICDHGRFSELQMVADSWYSVFPDDKGEGGHPVEKIFVTGNHDFFGHWEGSFRKDPEENWKKLFHEEWKPIFVKKVKGYTFVNAHWAKWYGGKLDHFLNGIKDQLSPDKPFFYTQHPHLKDTIFGPWAWGAWDDRGFGRRALNAYPNAFSFSGHSHFSLTDERDIWQGEFTAVGTSSLSYADLPYGRENASLSAMDKESQMKHFGVWNAKQGMLMQVWDHVIVLDRYDFDRMEKLDESWVIPILHNSREERPFAFENRAKQTLAPEFPKDAKITLEYRDGKNRRGTPTRQLAVRFPAAQSLGWKQRVYDYEVSAELVDYDTVKPHVTKRVYQKGVELNVRHVAKDAECVFALSELPAAKKLLRFSVTPINCYGKRGRTIYAPYTPPPKA